MSCVAGLVTYQLTYSSTKTRARDSTFAPQISSYKLPMLSVGIRSRGTYIRGKIMCQNMTLVKL